MGIVKVNRSGRNYNVYASNEYGAEKIGTIYNNEVFTWRSAFPGNGEGGYYAWEIEFQSTKGYKERGIIYCLENEPVFTNITAVAKFTKEVYGT